MREPYQLSLLRWDDQMENLSLFLFFFQSTRLACCQKQHQSADRGERTAVLSVVVKGSRWLLGTGGDTRTCKKKSDGSNWECPHEENTVFSAILWKNWTNTRKKNTALQIVFNYAPSFNIHFSNCCHGTRTCNNHCLSTPTCIVILLSVRQMADGRIFYTTTTTILGYNGSNDHWSCSLRRISRIELSSLHTPMSELQLT